MISKDKEEILFKKPLNAIKAAANKKLEDIAKELVKTEQSVVLYNTPDDELDEKKENIAKATRRLSKKIEGLSEEIDDEFNNIIRIGKRDLEDAVDSACRKLNSIVDNWGTLQSFDKIQPQLESEINILQTRTLKRITEDIARNAKLKLRGLVRDFFSEAEEVFYKYLPDVDTEDLSKKAQRKIELDIDNDEIFRNEGSDDTEEGSGIGSIIEGAVVGFLGGLIGAGIYYGIKNWINHSKTVAKLKSVINEMQSTFDPSVYLNVLMNGKERTIAAVTETFKEGILADLQNQIEEIQGNLSNKEKALSEAKQLRDKLQDESAEVKKQMAEMGINE